MKNSHDVRNSSRIKKRAERFLSVTNQKKRRRNSYLYVLLSLFYRDADRRAPIGRAREEKSVALFVTALPTLTRETCAHFLRQCRLRRWSGRKFTVVSCLLRDEIRFVKLTLRPLGRIPHESGGRLCFFSFGEIERGR